jgi:RNA polymerase-associated protein
MMTLYSGTTDPFSQRCRFVLFEKGMDFKVIDVDMFNKPDDLAVINPDNKVPVLVERDLVLYEANIINEYIDERFPHPQLMSHDPVMRARTRLFLHRFEKELFCHIDAIEHGQQKIADKARQTIRDNLTQISVLFAKQKYILGDEFSMLDVAIAPLLWRLGHYGIQLDKETAPPLMKYAERIFSRPAYIAAMTPAEKAMRK